MVDNTITETDLRLCRRTAVIAYRWKTGKPEGLVRRPVVPLRRRTRGTFFGKRVRSSAAVIARDDRVYTAKVGRGIIIGRRPVSTVRHVQRLQLCAASRRYAQCCITTMMRHSSGLRFFAFLLIVACATRSATAGRHVSNLSAGCLRCLCHASTACNKTIGCSRGFCGPYYLHRDYWKDAGQLVLQDDDPERDQAFVDCAADADCAQKVVENYMVKWGRDCNKDGVTDCDDYARTHFNGREDCAAIEKTNFGRRYETCRPAGGGGGRGKF